jgi:peptidylprolyl isomerase
LLRKRERHASQREREQQDDGGRQFPSHGFLRYPFTTTLLLVGFSRLNVRCFNLKLQIKWGRIMTEPAKKGDTVRVHYTGRLDDGQVFDSSEGGEPFEFTVGAGQVIPGFDEGVRGMNVGETRRIEIESDDAYGPHREELVQTLPRESINLDVEPQVGMNLVMQTPDGNQIPLSVTEVTDTNVTFDANHPLAGQKLTFDIQLVGNDGEGGSGGGE